MLNYRNENVQRVRGRYFSLISKSFFSCSISSERQILTEALDAVFDSAIVGGSLNAKKLEVLTGGLSVALLAFTEDALDTSPALLVSIPTILPILNYAVVLPSAVLLSSRNVEAVKFLWKRKHFEERDWKQTRKRLTLYEAESGSKKYSTASTSLLSNLSFRFVSS